MLQFQKSGKLLGRADVIGLVIINGDCVERCPGRPGFETYFLIRVTFDQNQEYGLDKIPTGHITSPYIESPDEMMITDGDTYWEAARHLTPEALIELKTPINNDLWILSEDEYPERLKKMSIADRDHVVAKIRQWVEKQYKDQATQTDQ